MVSIVALFVLFLCSLTTFQCNVAERISTLASKSCRASSQDDIEECEKDWEADEEEECCIFAKLKHCVKGSLESDENCSEDQVKEVYNVWRNNTDFNHSILSRRCQDYSHDSLECLYLNNRPWFITILTIMSLTLLASCFCFLWILMKRGSSIFRVSH